MQVEQEAANRRFLPARFADFDPATARAIHRGAIYLGNRATSFAQQLGQNRLTGYKGAAAGLGIGYADAVYEGVVEGWQTGDWSKFWVQSAEFGAVAAVGVAALAIVAGAAAGTAAAPFVAAGVAVAGVVGTGIALGNLIGKVINDISGIKQVPETEGAIANRLQENALFIGQVGQNILYDRVRDSIFGTETVGNEFQLSESAELGYVVDDQNIENPDQVVGTDASELFRAIAGAKVEGEGGSDEIYHFGYGEADGGAGQDILVGVDSTPLESGEILQPWLDDIAEARRVENERIRDLNIELSLIHI